MAPKFVRSAALVLALTCLPPLAALDLDLTLEGGYGISGAAFDVALSGNYAYLAAGSAGLQVINITNPAAPRRVGGRLVNGEAEAIAVSGNHAYVLTRNALTVIAITNPTNPIPAGSYSATGSAVDVAVSGGYAHVVENQYYTGSNYIGGGVQVINITNPGNPLRVGSYFSTGEAVAVAISGNYAYVADQQRWDGTNYVGGGLEIFNIGNRANPTRVGRLPMIGTPHGVAVAGRYVYVAAHPDFNGGILTGGGLHVIDAINPANPRRVGGFDPAGFANDVAVAGRHACVADRGLNVIDINNPTSPQRVGRYDTAEFVQAVAISGNYACLADGKALALIDISNAATPQLAGGYAAQNNARDVVLSGNYAYVADGVAGLEIIDISQVGRAAPGALPRVGHYFTGIPANSAAMFESYACVVATDPSLGGQSFLHMIDVSNAAAPRNVASLPLSDKPSAIAVSGHYAYVAAEGGSSESGGLFVIDISDPTNPQHVGDYETPDTPAAVDVVVSGNYAYLVDSRTGLHVLDISNPANPQRIGGYATPRGGCAGICIDWEETWAGSVAILGNHAYLAELHMLCGHGCRPIGGNLQVLDISNPSNPRRVGGYSFHAQSLSIAFADEDTDLIVSGSYAYMANGGLHVIDITNPANPQRVGGYETASRATALAVSGGRVCLAAGHQGLQIISAAAANPQRLGRYSTQGIAHDAAVAGNYAYVAASPWFDGTNDIGGGLDVIDLSDLTQPRRVGGYSSNELSAVTTSGSYAYAAAYDSLQIINVANPANPRRAGVYETNGFPTHVAVSGNYAYSSWGNSLRILDISNPASPRLTSTCVLTGSATRVAISGNFAYVAEQAGWPAEVGGLEVINISDPAKPRRVGAYFTGLVSQAIALSGSHAWLGNETGLHALDISNPANPQRIGGYATTDSVMDIAIAGNYAYVAKQGWTQLGSLDVIDISNPAAPRRVGGNSAFPQAALTAANGKLFAAAGEHGLMILHLYQPASNTSRAHPTPCVYTSQARPASPPASSAAPTYSTGPIGSP